jgi:hypothetical protein
VNPLKATDHKGVLLRHDVSRVEDQLRYAEKKKRRMDDLLQCHKWRLEHVEYHAKKEELHASGVFSEDEETEDDDESSVDRRFWEAMTAPEAPEVVVEASPQEFWD